MSCVTCQVSGVGKKKEKKDKVVKLVQGSGFHGATPTHLYKFSKNLIDGFFMDLVPLSNPFQR